jgi:hypothetical protein
VYKAGNLALPDCRPSQSSFLTSSNAAAQFII